MEEDQTGALGLGICADGMDGDGCPPKNRDQFLLCLLCVYFLEPLGGMRSEIKGIQATKQSLNRLSRHLLGHWSYLDLTKAPMCRQFEAVYLCHYGLWSLLENGIMNSKININSMGIPGS